MSDVVYLLDKKVDPTIAPYFINSKGEGGEFIDSCHYYRDEQFLLSPIFPGVLVGNYGTVLIRNNAWTRAPHLITRGRVMVRIPIPWNNFKTAQYTLGRLVLATFCPIDDYNSRKINRILNNDQYNNIYDPGKPWHNLEWKI